MKNKHKKTETVTTPEQPKAEVKEVIKVVKYDCKNVFEHLQK